MDPTEGELDHLHELEAGESKEGYVHDYTGLLQTIY